MAEALELFGCFSQTENEFEQRIDAGEPCKYGPYYVPTEYEISDEAA